MRVETQEQCNRKGGEITTVKHVIDLAFPDGNNVPLLISLVQGPSEERYRVYLAVIS